MANNNDDFAAPSHGGGHGVRPPAQGGERHLQLADLDLDLGSPTEERAHPPSPRADKGSKFDSAAEANSAGAAWKPGFARRRSWEREDQKHALQMRVVEGPGAATASKGTTTAGAAALDKGAGGASA